MLRSYVVRDHRCLKKKNLQYIQISNHSIVYLKLISRCVNYTFILKRYIKYKTASLHRIKTRNRSEGPKREPWLSSGDVHMV